MLRSCHLVWIFFFLNNKPFYLLVMPSPLPSTFLPTFQRIVLGICLERLSGIRRPLNARIVRQRNTHLFVGAVLIATFLLTLYIYFRLYFCPIQRPYNTTFFPFQLPLRAEAVLLRYPAVFLLFQRRFWWVLTTVLLVFDLWYCPFPQYAYQPLLLPTPPPSRLCPHQSNCARRSRRFPPNFDHCALQRSPSVDTSQPVSVMEWKICFEVSFISWYDSLQQVWSELIKIKSSFTFFNFLIYFFY